MSHTHPTGKTETGDMAVNLYAHVKAKLIGHGVQNSGHGRLVLSDKRLFLLFVGLERAVRARSFDAVRARVDDIEHHATSLRCRHVVVFAYMYLSLSPLAPRRTYPDVAGPDGRIRKCFDYDRTVSDEERLIGDWARIWCHRYAKHCFRALYGVPLGT